MLKKLWPFIVGVFAVLSGFLAANRDSVHEESIQKLTYIVHKLAVEQTIMLNSIKEIQCP